MTRLLMEKRPGRLRPVDEDGMAALAKLADGRVVAVEFKQARNPRQFRLFWALVSLIHQHHPRFATREQAADALKIAVGYFDVMTTYDGAKVPRPKSISFESMPQDQWAEFFDAVIRFVVEHVLPGVAEKDLRSQLEDMVGAR